MTSDRLDLSVQNAAGDPSVPPQDFIESCVRRVLAGMEGELVVRIVDESESAGLNERFRGKRGPTNVLAFAPGEVMALGEEPKPLGDIVICGPVVAREAEEQAKPLQAHWAHVLIHACLHLCGFDHALDAEAERMEAEERAILAEFGIRDPYRDEA